MAIINFISTVWSENLLKQLENNHVGVLNCNREYEGDINEQGSIVKICGVGDVTVSDYTKNTDILAPETLSDTVRTLKIDQAKYFNFQIDDVDRAQSNPKLMDAAIATAATAIANEADKYVYSLYEFSNYSITDDVLVVDNIGTHIMDSIIQMVRRGANIRDIIIEVTPEIAILLYKAKLVDTTTIQEPGLIGTTMGCKLYVSNNIVIDEEGYHKCIMRTKRSVAFAEQVASVEAYRPEGRFADGVKGLYLFGAKIVYPAEFIVLDFKLTE